MYALMNSEVKRMKKLLCLLTLVCCLAMSLSVAYASPVTGDTSNMGLWIAMVVVAVVLLVVLVIIGAKKKK
jgi:ABC-type transport system involved in cytochrome c biogenesis permease component